MAINNPFVSLSTFHASRNYLKVKYFVFILLLLSLILSLSGCVTLADPEASQEYTSDPVGVIDAQTNLGQSFISRRSNLNGITIWITTSSGQTNKSSSNISNNINVKLYLNPEESSPVFTTTINVPASVNNVPLTISIPDQKNPAGQNYYLLLTKDSGSIQINGRNEDAYPLGQAYVNNKPDDADIAFRISYNYDFISLVQDIKHSIGYFWIIAPLLVVLWLPGWLLLDLSGIRSRFEFGEQTAISTGLSLAMIPVIMLWTTILKIRWTSRGVFFAAGFLIAILIARLVYNGIISRRNHRKPGTSQSRRQTLTLAQIFNFLSNKSIVLILIFLVSLAVRLIMVRDLATSAWVDSVHHALFTRLIIDNGTYPASYLPFLNINPTAYHLGFHSIVAALTWLSNIDITQSLLILGQVLNAFSVFSIYLFTTRLTRSSSAGLFAAIITGFLTPMPAYYTSWGRYTELTGLILLPVVLTLIQLWMDGNPPKRIGWIIFLGAITAGGLFMVHYRVTAFLVCLTFSYVVFDFVERRNGNQIKPGRILSFVFSIAALGIILILPWFIRTLQNTVLPIVNNPVTSPVSFFQGFSWTYLTSTFGKQTLVLAGLGLIWSIINRRIFPFILIVWILFLILLANLDALRLPGGGLINNTSVEIMFFIPISILGGYFIDQTLNHWKALIPHQVMIPSMGIILMIFGFIMYLGAKQLVAIINPITILSRNADLQAIDWVSKNIPENETIVINPFAWGYGLYAGSDGGYWISSLSGRATIPPPVLYGSGSGVNEINQQSQQIITLSPEPSALWEFLSSQQLHYIYTGAKGGVISPEKLASSGFFRVLYHQDGVWILSVKP